MPPISKIKETVIFSPQYTTSTSADVRVSSGPAVSLSGVDIPSESELESAVFGYLQSIRALGRTNINSTEIADALSISLADVHRAITNLGNRGVQVVG